MKETLRGCVFFRLDLLVQRPMEIWWNNKHDLKKNLNIFPKFTKEEIICYLKENFNINVDVNLPIEELISLCVQKTLNEVRSGNKCLLKH
jgi:hypothetical protein